MTCRFILGLAAIGLLQGCAVNQLRTEYAGVVTDRADATIDGARDFLVLVGKGRRDANIDLAAADPACARLAPRLRATPQIGPDAPKIGFLCTLDPQDTTAFALLLAPIEDELEPTFLQLEALAAYAEALARILEDTPEDPAQPLVQALELAHAAQSALAAVAGTAGGPVPSADSAQAQAAANLVTFLGELRVEADRVDGLRAFVRSQPNGLAPITAALARHIRTWERSRSADAGLRLSVTTAEAASVLQAVPPAPADARRAALMRFYQRHDAMRAERAIAPALLAAIDGVAAADGDLRRVLRDRPDLNARERRRVADLSRKRVLTGLNHLAALARAIRGG